MNIQAVETLANLVANSSIYEVTVIEGQDSIRVKNSSIIKPNQKESHLMESLPVASPQVDPILEKKHHIRSTQIGWFQVAGDTIADPLVKVGDGVSVGQTLAFIGVMGKLEPIISTQVGRIKAILAENEQPVEYGTSLFELED